MATAISTTLTPTVIISVGPPLGASKTGTTTAASPASTLITSLSPSPATTFVTSQSSTSATSSPSPATPPNNSLGTVNNGDSNSQNYPIGLIAGIVTGFSILMLVMGVLFVILWRHNKTTKRPGDSEAIQMRDHQSVVPLYYMPAPPAQPQQKAIESGPSTPVRGARFAPEPEMMTPWPPRPTTGSPCRSGHLNKPWPPTPRDSQGVMRSPDWPLRDAYLVGDDDSNAAAASPTAPPLPPGRIINHPDPLHANGFVTPATQLPAVLRTPSKTTRIQHQQPSSCQSPEDGPRSSSTQKDIFFPPANLSDNPEAWKRSHSAADYRQISRRSSQRFSELAPADSTAQSHFALSPPPRRAKTSESEATKSTGAGKISRTPGLRLSGVSQGTIRIIEGERESVNEGEADPMSQRATWCGESKSHGDRGDNTTPPQSKKRRFSQ